jgi:hypothetical protein
MPKEGPQQLQNYNFSLMGNAYQLEDYSFGYLPKSCPRLHGEIVWKRYVETLV